MLHLWETFTGSLWPGIYFRSLVLSLSSFLVVWAGLRKCSLWIWFVFETLEKALTLFFFTTLEYLQGHSSFLWQSTRRKGTISATPVCFGTTFSTEIGSCLHFSKTCHTEKNNIELIRTCNESSLNLRTLSYFIFSCCLNSIVLFCSRKLLIWINVFLFIIQTV